MKKYRGEYKKLWRLRLRNFDVLFLSLYLHFEVDLAMISFTSLSKSASIYAGAEQVTVEKIQFKNYINSYSLLVFN